MRTFLRSIVSWVELGLIVIVASACATTANPLTGPTEFDTLMPGWQSKFTLDWKAEPAQDGTSRLYGRVFSRYGQHAEPFRVLGLALDQGGKVVGQRIEWVPGGVPGFGQVYFEIGHLAGAASYRVTVWDYTFIEAAGTFQ
jgi:hypothetical protein